MRPGEFGFFLTLGRAPEVAGGTAHARHRGKTDQRLVSLADYVAEAAVECGLSLEQARKHSPAQLKLLRKAANRVRADAALAQMHTTYAAFAAVMAKNGRRAFEQLQNQLKVQVNE